MDCPGHVARRLDDDVELFTGVFAEQERSVERRVERRAEIFDEGDGHGGLGREIAILVSVIPAYAGIQAWVPAYAGTTESLRSTLKRFHAAARADDAVECLLG